MSSTKKQLLERIQFLEEQIDGLECIVKILNNRIDNRNQLEHDVLMDFFKRFPIMFQSVIEDRHPGMDNSAKIAKIREYRELFDWGLREAKLFVEVGRIPE